jgi:hypothetical protein
MNLRDGDMVSSIARVTEPDAGVDDEPVAVGDDAVETAEPVEPAEPAPADDAE